MRTSQLICDGVFARTVARVPPSQAAFCSQCGRPVAVVRVAGWGSSCVGPGGAVAGARMTCHGRGRARVDEGRDRAGPWPCMAERGRRRDDDGMPWPWPGRRGPGRAVPRSRSPSDAVADDDGGPRPPGRRQAVAMMAGGVRDYDGGTVP